jgi:hypothetical protein
MVNAIRDREPGRVRAAAQVARAGTCLERHRKRRQETGRARLIGTWTVLA